MANALLNAELSIAESTTISRFTFVRSDMQRLNIFKKTTNCRTSLRYYPMIKSEYPLRFENQRCLSAYFSSAMARFSSNQSSFPKWIRGCDVSVRQTNSPQYHRIQSGSINSARQQFLKILGFFARRICSKM